MVCTCLLILCRVSPPAEFDNHDIIMGDVCLLSMFAVCMVICVCVFFLGGDCEDSHRCDALVKFT